MFSKIKRYLAVVAFSLFTMNAFAVASVPDDFGLIVPPGQTLFHKIAINDDPFFSGSWTFELEKFSFVSVDIDDFSVPLLFSEHDLFLFVDGKSQSPTSFAGILRAGVHTIDVSATVLNPGQYNGIHGSIGVILAPAVPELSTYAMLFLGMGFVSFVNRKKKQ